jgi:hypothetical protein
MREAILQKFHHNSKPDLKEQYLSKAQDVSLQVGKDDSKERALNSHRVGHFLEHQISAKKNSMVSERQSAL